MDFTMIQDEELFEEPFLSEYRDEMKFFYSELVDLNLHLFIIDKIRRFRFDLFVSPNQTIFFSTVLNSFFDSSILRITRLVTDAKESLRTIKPFKNKIIKNMKPHYVDDFKKRLKEVDFEKNTNELQNKIRARRDQRIAHMIRNFSEEELRNSTVYLKDLFDLREQLNLLLSALSFGTARMMLPLAYSELVEHPVGVDSRTDIERILDQIAFDSQIVSLPEACPILWEARKKQLEEHDIQEINRYRQKLGLANV
ncbi:hypothetical protein P0100_24235 [Yersinia pestis]|nr:hypothetical protein [Yersinia pestis]